MGLFRKAKETKHERLSEANIKKLFEQYDVDHSGTLDHDELAAFRRPSPARPFLVVPP